MKPGTKLVTQPIVVTDRESGKVLNRYLPDILQDNVIHRITRIKRNGFGILVKTDRLQEWININWFAVI